MQRYDDHVEVRTDEARGGETPHIVRYVLIASLILAIGAMSVIWISGAYSADQPNKSGPVSGQATPSR